MEVEKIKEIRKRLGMTQSELARESGVSQSLIAKIESGNIDPSFSNAKRIFNTLDSIAKKNELKAGDIMHKKIISVKQDSDIKAAIKLMKNHKISQLPVIEENKSIGMISESIILEAILNSKTRTVREIMQDSAPVVSSITCIHTVSALLKSFPIVLISKNGMLKGVITKSDIIETLY